MAGELCSIEGGFVIHKISEIGNSDYTIKIEDVVFSLDKIVSNQLKKSDMIALFICTAGNGIEKLSKKLFKKGEFLKGYIADVIGSTIVESATDKLQEHLKNIMSERSLSITNRYSPGYCGWNVSEQQKLFSLLPPNFCNISLTESSLMYPIKSVSGVIGIGNHVKHSPYICHICNQKDCIYRNRKISKGS
jgi:cobalamin-dependent methionine synthase I